MHCKQDRSYQLHLDFQVRMHVFVHVRVYMCVHVCVCVHPPTLNRNRVLLKSYNALKELYKRVGNFDLNST